MDSKYKVQEFVAHSTRVNCLSFGPKSNQVLATGGEDCKVNIWRVGNVSNIWTLSQNKAPIQCLCFDSDEQCVVSGTNNGSLKVFDLNVGKLARNLGSHPVGVTSVQYHPYGEFIVSGSVDCTMKVWDVRAKSCIQTYNGHTKEVTCVRFSPDGKWVGSASKDGQMQFWDLIAGKLVNSIKLQPVYVRTFEFSPSDFTVAAATSMRTVRFWDLDTMEAIGTTTSESNAVQAIAYSSLGSAMYVASKDTLKLWDLEPSLAMRNTVETGWEKIDDMKISHDYQLVAGSCMSNFVSVWSVDLQELMQEALGQSEDSGVDTCKDRNSTKSDNTAYSNNNPSISTGAAAGPFSYNGRNAGAKGVDASPSPVAPPVRTNVQLNDVRRQLSQLSSDLGFSERNASSNVSGGAQDKYTMNDLDDRSYRGGSHRYADSKNQNFDDDADEKPFSRSRPTSSAVVAAVGASIAMSAAADAKGIITEEEQITQVVWEGGHSQSQEMATSMGESFWKRFKQSQQAGHARQCEEQEDKEEDIPEEIYDEDSDFGEDKDDDADEIADEIPYQNLEQRLSMKEEVGISEEELADMLPPPSYGDHDSDNDNKFYNGNNNSKGYKRNKINPPPSAVSAKRVEDPSNNRVNNNSNSDNFNNNNNPPPRAASVRYSPLAGNSNNAVAAADNNNSNGNSEEYAQYPANYPRKAATPSFPRPQQGARVPTPSGFQIDQHQQPSRGNSSKNLLRGAAPDSSDSAKVGMEVVGMRHLRSPSGGTPASAQGRGGFSAQGNGNGGDSESRTVGDLLEQLLGESVPTRATLTQRLQSLKLLRLLWERGEISDCIDHLVVLSDTLSHNSANLATLSDFFDAAELRGNGLSLDSCVRLLPVLESMLSMERGFPSEHVMYATFKSFSSLASGFGDLIRNTRATIVVSGGVDLSREERLNKCNACFDVFYRVSGRVDQFKRQYRASRSTVDILDVFRDQSMRYFH